MSGVRGQGATLIELTLALTVISALCAVTLPRAASFVDSIEVRGAVTEVESLFSLARHVAISRGAQSVLEIDGSSGTISIRVGAEPVMSRDVGPAHGVLIDAGRASMTYSPIGVGYGAANFSMVIRRNAVADTVIISRLGRVRHQ